jgi:CheY-like chemotaxis protein
MQPSSPGGSFSRRPLRVLLVEDDAFQIGAIAKLIGKSEELDQVDIRLDFAGSAKEAVAACELHATAGNPHDLVMLDFLLPGGDADTCVERIRSILGKQSVSCTASSLTLCACCVSSRFHFHPTTGHHHRIRRGAGCADGQMPRPGGGLVPG